MKGQTMLDKKPSARPKLLNRLSIGIAAAVVASGASAFSGGVKQSGLQINPGAGYYQFDSDQQIEDSAFAHLGLEYQFKSGFALEGSYVQNATESSLNSAQDIDYDQYRIDGLYYFRQGQRFQPYLSAGVGEANLETNSIEADETLVNGGLGARYFLTPALSLRGDARLFNSQDNETTANAVTLTLSYLLGGEERSKPKSKPVIDLVKTPVDTDKDGINDDIDQCSGTPAGLAVDAKGCLLDSDQDGIADAEDKCVDTAAGAEIDAMGCAIVAEVAPEVVEEPVVAEINNLDDVEAALKASQKIPTKVSLNLDVKFGNNNSYLSEDYYPEVERLANFLKAHETAKVTIEGHSDNLGNADYNKMLSEKRAKHIQQLLVERYQVPQDKLGAIGYGEERPVADNTTAEGRSINRRVTASVTAEVLEDAKE